MSEYAVIVFGKNPVPGTVKTRLASEIGPDAAAELYRAFFLDTLVKCNLVACDVRLYLEATDEQLPPELEPFDRLGLRQSGVGLGQRMAHAIRETLHAGYSGAVIVGSDLPTMPHSLIAAALDRMQDDRVVIAPSSDGGYCLVGLSGEAPYLFDLVFSHGRVLDQTLARVRELGLEPTLLEEWYDIDTVEDLERLVEDVRMDASQCPHTFHALVTAGLIENTRFM